MLIGLWVAAKLGYERGQRAAARGFLTPPPRRRQPPAKRRWRAHRTARPWLGVIGVALLTQAVLLAGVGCLLPAAAALAWSWCPTDWRWTWLLPLACGTVGAAWAVIGVGLLQFWPCGPGAALWVASAVGFAGAGHVARSTLFASRGIGR